MQKAPLMNAYHSKEPPVSFTKASLHPSYDAWYVVSFGAAEDEVDDDAMSTAASDSGDWSTCQESEASHSEEPPAPIDEELVKILSEAVQDVGLDWSPPEQPNKNRLDMQYQVAAPQRPAPFFPEVHEEISLSWRSPYSARAQAAG
ncbi:dynein heavy chain axonemal-like protein [Labeo rohita]|uniref:Dynein heavy chain axonemal-like protein n=1 Tax=Labeo rohita TaxID=84645 RepID=A0A498NSR8_LABRO|nr:dynein heavy chain axonemal-like protein [Labeo rohita]